MRRQIFCPRENPDIAAQIPETLAANRLDADALYEVGGRQPSAAPRPAARGQNVVAATRVITKRLRGKRTDENRYSGRNAFEGGSARLRKA